MRLAQVLAYLRYLPATFEPARGEHAWPSERAAEIAAVRTPPRGHFTMGRGWPARLHILWASDRSVLLTGAVRAFEAQHGLPMDGVATQAVWNTMLRALTNHQLNPAGYSYALVTEGSPEWLTLYNNGRIVVHSLANTGLPGASTALGNYYVYERLRSQVMQGTNLDGSHYADPVSWVAYFHGGDAFHYIPRGGYGWPQSLGCVELPWSAAETAWGYLPYGTLVTITT